MAKKQGLSDSEPIDPKKIVADYPERPYADAVTDEQREALKAEGIEVPKGVEVDPSTAPPDA